MSVNLSFGKLFILAAVIDFAILFILDVCVGYDLQHELGWSQLGLALLGTGLIVG